MPIIKLLSLLFLLLPLILENSAINVVHCNVDQLRVEVKALPVETKTMLCKAVSEIAFLWQRSQTFKVTGAGVLLVQGYIVTFTGFGPCYWYWGRVCFWCRSTLLLLLVLVTVTFTVCGHCYWYWVEFVSGTEVHC